MVILDHRVHLDCQVHKVTLVHKDKKEDVDLMGSQAQLDSLEVQARLESQDNRESSAKEVLMVHPVLLDLQA